jgi:hypothetical protein
MVREGRGEVLAGKVGEGRIGFDTEDCRGGVHRVEQFRKAVAKQRGRAEIEGAFVFRQGGNKPFADGGGVSGREKGFAFVKNRIPPLGLNHAGYVGFHFSVIILLGRVLKTPRRSDL